jgi:hypothetical protein
MEYANEQNSLFMIAGFHVFIAKNEQNPSKSRSGYEVNYGFF